jgi:hypothetical protein
VAAGVLALTVTFCREHHAELRAIPDSLHAFRALLERYGALSVLGAAQSGAGVLVAALIVLAWYGIGNLLARRLQLSDSAPSGYPARSARAFHLARACALGAGIWSLVWFTFGLAGLYRTAVALAALALGLTLAVLAVLRSRDGRESVGAGPEAPTKSSALARVGALLTALPVLLAFVGALAPPTAKDALQYHLALPKEFLAAGRFVDVPGNIAAYFPLGAEMHAVWAMLLGRIVSARAGEAAAGAVLFAFFPLLLVVVFGWASELGLAREWAWLGVALVAGVPTIFDVAASSYVDLALALYLTLAIRGAARWWSTQDGGHLAESAAALGFALAVKLTAGFMLIVLALIVLIRTRGAASGSARATPHLGVAAAALVAAVVIGSPWYVRTWARTGSPVFPFFANVWPGHAPGWDLGRSAMLHGFNALYGGAVKGPLDYLLTPLSLSLTAQREVAASYEGVLGVSFLVSAILIVWAVARGGLDPELKIAAAVGGAFFVWWLASAQVLRYLLPGLPLLAVAGAGAAAILTSSRVVGAWLGWLLAVSILSGEIVTVSWVIADNPVLAVTGAEPRSAYLERRLDYYQYYRVINGSLPANATIWLVDTRRDTYHLERPYVGDYLFEDYTLRQWIETVASGRDVQRRALAAGITHVLIRHDVLFDYAHSPLVDDQRPRADNLARLERLRSFLADGTRVLRADRKFALVELRP